MVESVTTIATPHHGSSYADWAVEHIGSRMGVERLIQAVGLPTAAFHHVTRRHMFEEVRLCSNGVCCYAAGGN